MPNVAALLKSEITRVARKEVRAEVAGLRKTLAQQKTRITALQRELAGLDRTVAGLVRRMDAAQAQAGGSADQADGEAGAAPVQRRFSAARMLAHRQKLGMSVAEYAALAGVSGPTLRAWELGKRRPTDAQMPGVVAARGARPADER